MDEKDYTEKERAEAKRAVARMMDGGKTDAMLEEMGKKLTAFAETNKEENSFLLLVNTGDLGKVYCAVGGKMANLCFMLDTALDDAEILANVVDKVTTVRALQKLFNAISGKGAKPVRDDDDDD